jgi:hypothetical protein
MSTSPTGCSNSVQEEKPSAIDGLTVVVCSTALPVIPVPKLPHHSRCEFVGYKSRP